MPPSILIAYSTRGGATGEVSESIAVALRESGLPVEVCRVKELKFIDDRDAVILGAPLYMGGFPGEFRRFLETHRTALLGLPIWCFVLGPVEAKPEQFDSARRQAEKQLAAYAWLKPIELKIFGGRFDFQRIGFPFSLLRHLPAFPLRKSPAMDIRDWDAIRAWAQSIAVRLKTAA